jgi:predicted metalloprotease with PDZ domain
LLAQAGLVLRPAAPGHGWIGAGSVNADAGGVMLTAAPVSGSPLDGAGLDAGDRIVSVNGAAVTDATAWGQALDRLTPGATVTLRFVRDGAEQQRSVRALADPRVQIVRVEATGGAPSGKQRAFRAGWLTNN